MLLALAVLAVIGGARASNYTQAALNNIATLQSQWFNPHAILYPWNTNGFWENGNTVEAITDTMLLLNEPDLEGIFPGILANQPVLYIVGDGSNDDNLWWCLAWCKVYQLTGLQVYLQRALLFYEVILPYWDTTVCGGGIWWSSARNYKNAVTNELFLMASLMLHRLRPENTTIDFLSYANLELEWFLNSGMINDQYLINDGLTVINNTTCVNNQQTEWTYNQGVILGGLLQMYLLTENRTLIDIAVKLANASSTLMTYPNGILKESCEPNNCDSDQHQFKGIYTRYLGYLTASGVLESIDRNQFAQFLTLQADSNINNNQYTNNGYEFYGVVWEGPYASSNYPATDQTSVLDAFNAAISVTNIA